MYLKNILLYNFKNFRETEISFCDGLNCFVGHNGAGKTNLLDAIHYLSLTKSYFGSLDTQNIFHGEENFSITGKYNDVSVQCIQKKGVRKIMRLDGKAYDKMASHIGKIPLIMIAPQDEELIIGGSDLRRKFIDVILSQLNHNYLEHLILYNGVLAQRNALLKQDVIDASLMELFDEGLISHGKIIFEERKKFMEIFFPVFEKYYEKMSAGIEKVSIIYSSPLNENSFEDILLRNADRDRFLQYTTSGIHKDDLDFLMDGYHVRKTGSQGQQKSFLLALRLAQWEVMATQMKVKPLLLLDDIFDKLDVERSKHLMLLLTLGQLGQIFISDTDKNRIENFILQEKNREHRVFSIDNGIVTEDCGNV
ncbi:MAG: DNA replication and repair protein RecF [Bacteroidales bacterium]|jgi:DNA replication and repair protein RecF|nr:DNA replication and repair protein RecF [Bacteroidales bacterium]